MKNYKKESIANQERLVKAGLIDQLGTENQRLFKDGHSISLGGLNHSTAWPREVRRLDGTLFLPYGVYAADKIESMLQPGERLYITVNQPWYQELMIIPAWYDCWAMSVAYKLALSLTPRAAATAIQWFSPDRKRHIHRLENKGDGAMVYVLDTIVWHDHGAPVHYIFDDTVKDSIIRGARQVLK